MDFYFVILFFHIASALGLFMGMSLEWVGTTKLQNFTTTEEASEWVKFLGSLKGLFIGAGILLLLTGIYLTAAKWHWTPWIIVSILLWLYIALHGSVVSGNKIKKLSNMIHSNTPPAKDELHGQVNKLRLISLVQSRLAVGLGTIFIMTVKPDLLGSIGVVIVAVILGLVPFWAKGKVPATN